MDHRKENWPFELECFRKGISGEDGYFTEISNHYVEEREEIRGYDRVDIACALLTGCIIEGYSFEENWKRQSRSKSLATPSRCILGKTVSGDWVVVVVGIWSSKRFSVITCTAPGHRHLQTIKELEVKFGWN